MQLLRYFFVIGLVIGLCGCGGGGGDDSGGSTAPADTTPPVISVNVTSPTPSDSQTLTGTVEAGAVVTVKVGSGSEQVASVSGTSWSLAISGLAPGSNTITVKARDAAGNVTTITDTIDYDNTAPALTLNAVTSPTNDANLTLSGTVDATATISVTVGNGADVAAVTYPIPTTTWQCLVTMNNEGDHAITVTATDAATNTSTTTSIVNYDITGPTIASTDPADAETGVPTNTTLVVTFSEPMDETTITAGAITLVDTDAPPPGIVTVTVACNPGCTEATFTPTPELTANHIHEISVYSGPTDLAGNALNLSGTTTYTFTTVEPAPPTLP